MNDVSLRQQYKINAMHGHDVGVWVCEASGLQLSPVLFMQALCPDPAPRPLLVKWKHPSTPPKAFRKDAALPLIYSECGRLPNWPYHLHVFAPQAPAAETVLHETGLQDWAWAVPIIGLVLIYNRKYDHAPNTFSFKRRHETYKSPLAWAQAQQLPFVIAAVDYENSRDDVQQFRQLYEIPAATPVLPGPAMVDARRKPGDGLFSGMFQPQELALDREYARSVLNTLLQYNERERAA